MRNEISRNGLFGWLLGAAMLAGVALIGSPAHAQDLVSPEPYQSPTADKHKAPPLDVAGMWSGPVEDNKAGPGTITLEFTQTGGTVGGTYELDFPDSDLFSEGSLTGKATSKSLKFKFHPDGTKKSCHGIFASTSATSGNVIGKYHAAGCSDGNNEKATLNFSPSL